MHTYEIGMRYLTKDVARQQRSKGQPLGQQHACEVPGQQTDTCESRCGPPGVTGGPTAARHQAPKWAKVGTTE